ncbi:MAG: hypothetical protein GY826_38125, partial [Fuerstiella sp.]|nr:hypothetical protein [Fuerstiella sp.]
MGILQDDNKQLSGIKRKISNIEQELLNLASTIANNTADLKAAIENQQDANRSTGTAPSAAVIAILQNQVKQPSTATIESVIAKHEDEGWFTGQHLLDRLLRCEADLRTETGERRTNWSTTKERLSAAATKSSLETLRTALRATDTNLTNLLDEARTDRHRIDERMNERSERGTPALRTVQDKLIAAQTAVEEIRSSAASNTAAITKLNSP